MTSRSTRGWRWTTWPRRTLRPTRDGWWCLAAAIGLGFAAMNTGNNLLYLLVSMLLALVIVSGALSEQSVRGLHFTAICPDEVFAGRTARLGLRVDNVKRWRSSYSIRIDVLDGETRRCFYVPRLGSGACLLVTWEARFAARGRQRFPAIRISTTFPFGLFVKAGHVALDTGVTVYPHVPVDEPPLPRPLGGDGSVARRRGSGSEPSSLRDYRAGDDPRLIHWRSSAKTGTLVVREPEREAAMDTRIVLVGSGHDRARLEAGLSDAAALAVMLLRRGAAVELVAPGAYVARGRGRPVRERLLTALAVYDPSVGPASYRGHGPAPVREIRVPIG